MTQRWSRCSRCEVGCTPSELENGLCRDCARLLRPERRVPVAPLAVLPEVSRDTLRKYGITHDDYLALKAEQGNRCAVCQRPPLGNGRLVIDHNHATGQVRGLLCGNCNTALGMLGDDPDVLRSASQYLRDRGHYGESKEQA